MVGSTSTTRSQLSEKVLSIGGWRTIWHARWTSSGLHLLSSSNSMSRKNGSRGEFLKFKWCVPSFLAAALYPNERADLEDWMSKRREKRNQRYVRALPHCTDEFGVGPDFLDATFSIAETPTIARHTRIFTMGSCFARNIAVFLQANGYNAEAFMQTEDLNSPFSNAQMLSV